MANPKHLNILNQGVSEWNKWRQQQDLTEPEVDPYGQMRASAVIHTGHYLIIADLSDADLKKADLSGADFRRVDLSGADLRKANLSGAVCRDAYLWQADFSWANLREADLSRAALGEANLSGADLSGADLRLTNLTDVDLNGATLTDACLWETQRAGWTIQGIICEAVYWDKDRKERTLYNPGEFERLYADKTKIVLHYEGGMSPIEVATLPALIQRIEATHPGCVLRLQSVQEAPGGATVTLVVENDGERNPDELRTLKTDIEIVSQRAIRAQRALLEERRIREQIEFKLKIAYEPTLSSLSR